MEVVSLLSRLLAYTSDNLRVQVVSEEPQQHLHLVHQNPQDSARLGAEQQQLLRQVPLAEEEERLVRPILVQVPLEARLRPHSDLLARLVRQNLQLASSDPQMPLVSRAQNFMPNEFC